MHARVNRPRLSARFDGVDRDDITVPPEALDRALAEHFEIAEPEELPRDAIRLPGGAGNTTRGDGIRRGVGFALVILGSALGYVMNLPDEDSYLKTREELIDQMTVLLGGRVAEQVVFGAVTTGAANDLEKVTSTSKHMIMRYGMSEKLGPRVLGRNHDMPFLGRDMGAEPDYSERLELDLSTIVPSLSVTGTSSDGRPMSSSIPSPYSCGSREPSPAA